MRSMKEQYGPERGERVFYASRNKGTLTGVERRSEGGSMAKRPGLYANINAKRRRIASGSGEKMRSPGSEGAPTDAAFERSARTARKAKGGVMRGDGCCQRGKTRGTMR
jgi:hypothetical protein